MRKPPLIMSAPSSSPWPGAKQIGVGFTVLELLSVITVVAILAALLFPSLQMARIAAAKARTRVQFNQWAAALEGFRSEYGYYPALDGSGLVNPPGQATDPSTLHLFHDILAARRRDGSPLPEYSASADSLLPESQNRKRISFHSFSAADFTPSNLLRDAFDNTEIAVLLDRNLDGVINAADYGDTLPVVNGCTPTSADIPVTGIRAGVIFYGPAPGTSPDSPVFIFSWK